MQNVETSTDKRLEKVRKLLALAESPAATAQEAETFTAKAAELIAEYGIDEALLAATAPDENGIEKRVMVLHAPYARDKATLAYAVATALGVQGVVSPGRDAQGRKIDELHLFGQKGDMTRVDVLVTSLMMQAARDVNRAIIPPWEDKAAYRRSWWSGFTKTISTRLREAEAAARYSNESRFASAGTSSALVVRNRDRDVSAAVRDEFPRTQTRGRKLSGSGTGAGSAAGRKANLGGTAVNGGRRQIGASA